MTRPLTKRIALLLCVALVQVPSASVCAAQASRDSIELDGRLALRGYEAMVEAHLGGVLNALKALAATQEAASGDWQRLKPMLAAYARGVSSAAAVWMRGRTAPISPSKKIVQEAASRTGRTSPRS